MAFLTSTGAFSLGYIVYIGTITRVGGGEQDISTPWNKGVHPMYIVIREN